MHNMIKTKNFNLLSKGKGFSTEKMKEDVNVIPVIEIVREE